MRVDVDPQLFRRALTNVIVNGVQASPYSGELRIESMRDGREAVITVMDKGPGLGANESERMFEAHWRGRRPRGPGSPGMGLGLAISARVIALHHGKISATNVPDGGALVELRLPLSE